MYMCVRVCFLEVFQQVRRRKRTHILKKHPTFPQIGCVPLTIVIV